MKHILTILLWYFPITTVWAVEYTVHTVPNNQLANSHAFVTNPEGIISTAAEWEINSKIAAIRDSTNAEIAVVLLHSIGNQDIDHFATDLFMLWGIGNRQNDNGLLFLLVYDQQQMVFRTGYGLEGVLPDAYLSRIIRNDISPHLKGGNFDAGVIAGIDKVCAYLLNPEATREIHVQIDNHTLLNKLKVGLYFYLFISLIVFTLCIMLLFRILRYNTTNYKRYLALDKGKITVIVLSVFFPVLILFCIFYFVLKKRMRIQPFGCSVCEQKMRRLNKPETDTWLTETQQTEQSVKSVYYDVWLCDNCGNQEIMRYDKLLSRFKTCPRCQAKTYYLKKNHTLKAATTYTSGIGERIFSCHHCHITQKQRYTIPRIVTSSGSNHRFGGSGGFSGGGSWGGGRTGGGGARGGW